MEGNEFLERLFTFRMSAAAIPAPLTWAHTDLKVDFSEEELPTLEACRELSISGGRAALLLYLREAGVKSLGVRRKIAGAVEKISAVNSYMKFIGRTWTRTSSLPSSPHSVTKLPRGQLK